MIISVKKAMESTCRSSEVEFIPADAAMLSRQRIHHTRAFRRREGAIATIQEEQPAELVVVN